MFYHYITLHYKILAIGFWSTFFKNQVKEISSYS